MDLAQRTITRRLDAVLNGLEEEFSSFCTREDVESALAAVKKTRGRSDRPSKLRKLFDLLDKRGIPYERGHDDAYYEELVKNAPLPSFSEMEDEMVYALFSQYEKYPAPEDYMKRIVDRLCKPEDGWEADTLRLRILKQFIKYGAYLSDAGYGGRAAVRKYVKGKTGVGKLGDELVLSELDDGIFSCLADATAEQLKPRGSYGLLKVADDLASGKFRVEGATKKSLYLFAMVFNMSYYAGDGSGTAIYDPDTDLETNLFRDYYTNNLLRFLTDVYRENRAGFERDPSGQGINYKNYAEMIYLYYIAGDYEPWEKIRLSGEMIERVRKRKAESPSGSTPPEDERSTGFFRQLFSEDILSLPEEEFEEYIVLHYDCGTEEGKRFSVSPLLVNAEQNSAFAAYRTVLQKTENLGVPPENCNYGLWFTDVAAFKKQGLENICHRRPEIDREKFEAFTELLLAANDFLGHTVDESVSTQSAEQEQTALSTAKTRALYVSAPGAITRTSLLVAYYYYYNALHESEADEKWKSFSEVFNDFKAGIDPLLDSARYQPLSGKNIFDVLVVFSSYAYMNLG